MPACGRRPADATGSVFTAIPELGLPGFFAQIGFFAPAADSRFSAALTTNRIIASLCAA